MADPTIALVGLLDARRQTGLRSLPKATPLRSTPDASSEATFGSTRLLDTRKDPTTTNLAATYPGRASEASARSRTGRDPAKRIQEAREKLLMLISRLQRASLMGDKHSAVAIAKEAATVAREIAAAVKEAAALARESGNASQGLIAASTGVPTLPVVAAEAPVPQDAAESDAAEASEQASAPGGGSGLALSPEALSALQDSEQGLDKGFVRDVSRTLLLVRHIMAIVKASLARKDPHSTPGSEEELAKSFRASEAEVREAIKEIEKAVVGAR